MPQIFQTQPPLTAYREQRAGKHPAYRRARPDSAANRKNALAADTHKIAAHPAGRSRKVRPIDFVHREPSTSSSADRPAARVGPRGYPVAVLHVNCCRKGSPRGVAVVSAPPGSTRVRREEGMRSFAATRVIPRV